MYHVEVALAVQRNALFHIYFSLRIVASRERKVPNIKIKRTEATIFIYRNLVAAVGTKRNFKYKK